MTSFDPENFLEFAKVLLNLSLPYNDAKIRTIMSRCYYAVHLLARKKLNLPDETRHKNVYREIKARSRIIGKELDYLWIYRIGADYRLITPCNIGGWAFKKKVAINLDEAQECIVRAERAAREVKRI
jgi:hypothetical protein